MCLIRDVLAMSKTRIIRGRSIQQFSSTPSPPTPPVGVRFDQFAHDAASHAPQHGDLLRYINYYARWCEVCSLTHPPLHICSNYGEVIIADIAELEGCRRQRLFNPPPETMTPQADEVWRGADGEIYYTERERSYRRLIKSLRAVQRESERLPTFARSSFATLLRATTHGACMRCSRLMNDPIRTSDLITCSLHGRTPFRWNCTDYRTSTSFTSY